MGINKVIFYPENYILLGSSDAQKAHADIIISEMKNSHPEKFEGNKDSFSFELRYAAPFDKGFQELKRLQGAAAEAAGRRNEFKGYIVIDMNSWLAHHDEEYLNKALLFLIDMSEYDIGNHAAPSYSVKPPEIETYTVAEFATDVVNERIRAPFTPLQKKKRVSREKSNKRAHSSEEEASSEGDLEAELMRKFDELFGTCDDE